MCHAAVIPRSPELFRARVTILPRVSLPFYRCPLFLPTNPSRPPEFPNTAAAADLEAAKAVSTNPVVCYLSVPSLHERLTLHFVIHVSHLAQNTPPPPRGRTIHLVLRFCHIHHHPFTTNNNQGTISALSPLGPDRPTTHQLPPTTTATLQPHLHSIYISAFA